MEPNIVNSSRSQEYDELNTYYSDFFSRERIIHIQEVPLKTPDNAREASVFAEKIKNIILTEGFKYTKEEVILLRERYEELKDYAAWKRGYSDIKVDGKEDYLLLIVPGASKYITKKDIEKGKRERKIYNDAVKYDLAKYYKYSRRMMSNKIKIYLSMSNTCRLLYTLFNKYGENAILSAKDTCGRIITVHYSHIVSLDKLCTQFLDEFKYISQAKNIRGFQGSGIYFSPDFNMKGRKRKILITKKAIEWIKEEPSLSEFRDYISVEKGMFFSSFIGKGMTTPHSLDLIIRIAIKDKFIKYKAENGRTRVKYLSTATLKKYYGIGEYIENFGISKIAKYMITNISYGKYNNEMDLFVLSDYQGTSDFLNEISMIQDYYYYLSENNGNYDSNSSEEYEIDDSYYEDKEAAMKRLLEHYKK
jgi:hypothetical protein